MHDICKQLHITYPIIQGGMGNISNAPLAAAVSEAGGLGMIGCGTMPADEVEAIIIETKKRTRKPFGINIAINVTEDIESIIALVKKHHIPVVSLSAGNPGPYISRFQQENSCVIVVVASVKHAEKAVAQGAGMLVAEGVEAAGINAATELTTFTLIPQIAGAVDVPILAAGGIGDGKGVAAALALGASGVQIGTRLIATEDAPFHETYKNALLKADAADAILIGRTSGPLRRVLRTPFTEHLQQLEKEGATAEEYHQLTSESLHRKGALSGDLHNGFMNGGQVAGLIRDIPAVHDLFRTMMEGARRRMETSFQLLSGREE